MKMSQNNGTNEPQLGRIEFYQHPFDSIEKDCVVHGKAKYDAENHRWFCPECIRYTTTAPPLVETAVDESIELNKGKAFQYRDHDEMSMTDCEGKKVTIEYGWDTDIYDTMDVVRRLLIANGFSPETVRNGFSYMWNEVYMDDAKENENESMVELLEWVQEMNLGNLSPSVIVKLYNKDIPNGMCNDCGTSSGAKVDEGCTWWKGVCEVCGDYKEVTDERDFK